MQKLSYKKLSPFQTPQT